MGTLCVTSLYQGSGSTAFCAGLACLLQQRGLRPALLKPVRIIGAAAPQEPDPDALFFARLQGVPLPKDWPVLVGSQEAQAGLKPSARERVSALAQISTGPGGGMIIEGPPMVTNQGVKMAIAQEVAEALDAQAVLLASYSPTLRAETILEAAMSFGGRLLGLVLNAVPRYRNQTAQTSLVAPLQQQGVAVLGVLPEERCLLGVTVDQIARHLGGEFLIWEEKREDLIDHFMIGGLVLDWGVHYFGQSETKAVIVRGDRPDIQMAALGTPTRCLVLTGGHRPIQYVEHEAREEEVPVVLVQSDTLTTARALETMFAGVPIHHPAKAECFARLLSRAVDVETIVRALE